MVSIQPAPRAKLIGLKNYMDRNDLKTQPINWKSQLQQDRWVAECAFPSKQSGYFVDIGAHNGEWISNTVVLERLFGWTGILIEADPLYFESLVRNRTSICVNVCVDAEKGEVEFFLPSRNDGLGGIVAADVDTTPEILKERQISGRVRDVVRMRTLPLADVLEAHLAPKTIDFMSIDIEGAEHRVLSVFPFNKWTFRTIAIERPKPDTHKLFTMNGYEKIFRHKWDTFYAHTDHFDCSRLRADTELFFANLSSDRAQGQ